MPCVFCEKDCKINDLRGAPTNQKIEQSGYDRAVVIHTVGNYGSQVLDGDTLSFVICDACVVKHSPKMLYKDNYSKEKEQKNAVESYIKWYKSLLQYSTSDSYLKDVLPYFKPLIEMGLVEPEKFLTCSHNLIRDFVKEKMQKKAKIPKEEKSG